MHLSLGRTRFNAFRFGPDPVRPINNGVDLHCSRSWTAETWRIAEEEEREGEGEGAAALAGGVRELRSTVLQREQWRHGAEGEGEGAAALGGGEGAALHRSSTWTVESPLFTLHNSGDMVQKEKGKGKGKGKGKEKGWLFICCKARHCYSVVTQLQQKQPQVASKKEKKEKGKGKGWLFLCCKARHCLLCCNTFATKAAPSCFDRPCVANAIKGGAHEQ